MLIHQYLMRKNTHGSGRPAYSLRVPTDVPEDDLMNLEFMWFFSAPFPYSRSIFLPFFALHYIQRGWPPWPVHTPLPSWPEASVWIQLLKGTSMKLESGKRKSWDVSSLLPPCLVPFIWQEPHPSRPQLPLGISTSVVQLHSLWALSLETPLPPPGR